MTDTDCAHEFSYWSGDVRVCLACESALEHRNMTLDEELAGLESVMMDLDKRAAQTLENARDHMERAADLLDHYGMTEEAARQRRTANECRSVIRFLSPVEEMK